MHVGAYEAFTVIPECRVDETEVATVERVEEPEEGMLRYSLNERGNAEVRRLNASIPR
jgi:hypothetical protein